MLRIGLILLLAGQFFAVAHASEHGTEHHEHGGVACVAVLTDEPDDLLPTLDAGAMSCQSASTPVTPATHRPPLARIVAARPPATGPPAQ